MNNRKYFIIYELNPAPNNCDFYRFVEAFESEEDAMVVWTALQEVNILFHCYKIIEETLDKTEIKMRPKKDE